MEVESYVLLSAGIILTIPFLLALAITEAMVFPYPGLSDIAIKVYDFLSVAANGKMELVWLLKTLSALAGIGLIWRSQLTS